jgi:hypothetical protein
MLIEHPGQFPILRDRLELSEVRARRNEQNELTFEFLTPALGGDKRVATWVAGYYPDGRTRNRTGFMPNRLLRDVVAYTVTVGATEREELLRWFRAYGYTIREEGERRIASGPEFTLTMLPEPASGVRTAVIEMSLTREKTGEQTYKIGDSELKFKKDRATLTFRFPKSN